MPIANRPDPLLPLGGATNPRATLPGTTVGTDRGPGFADWLARARPEPVRPPAAAQQPPRPERAERANPSPQPASPPARSPDSRATQRRHEPSNHAANEPERAPMQAANEAAALGTEGPDEAPEPAEDASGTKPLSADHAEPAIQAFRPDVPQPRSAEAGPLTGLALPAAAASATASDVTTDAEATAASLSLHPWAASGRARGPTSTGAAAEGHAPPEPPSSAADLDDAQGLGRPDPMRRGASPRAAGRGTPEPTDTAAMATSATAPGAGTPRSDGELGLRAARGGRDALPERGWRAEAVNAGTPLASSGADPSASLRLGGSSLAPTPAAAALAPPLDHPDFAAALGAQVAVWARDGQHEAELRLNPGSLGAVQVWIGVEGGQAQVRFTADLGSTRDALQAALPDLAQALAREGLQLGGADVQSRQQRGESPPSERRSGDRGPRGAQQAVVGLEGLPPPRPAGRGLLDLYA
jgi:flagellar hook-length control protein FliK